MQAASAAWGIGCRVGVKHGGRRVRLGRGKEGVEGVGKGGGRGGGRVG
jgi:hypothetical protein